ncbi:flagellar protein [Lachnospiraceae bacterium ZAX-1]
MNKIVNQFSSIEQLTDQYLKKSGKDTALIGQETSFEEILKQKQGNIQPETLKFSKHATMRLEDRNIKLSVQQQERLETGTKRAEEKGIKESLVIVDSLAFIVNIPNKTVVTAMDQGEGGNNIYTNIDGAVIM